jgi:hypothetical protein
VFDIDETSPAGTRTWRRGVAVRLEEEWGPLPWLHSDPFADFPGSPAYGCRWVAARGIAPPPGPVFAGTYRARSISTSSRGAQLVAAILHGAGYGLRQGVRGYSTTDWDSGKTLFDFNEFSDAPLTALDGTDWERV